MQVLISNMENQQYIRGHRAKLMVAEDWKVIPQEVLDEIINSFQLITIKEDFEEIIDRLNKIPN